MRADIYACEQSRAASPYMENVWFDKEKRRDSWFAIMAFCCSIAYASMGINACQQWWYRQPYQRSETPLRWRCVPGSPVLLRLRLDDFHARRVLFVSAMGRIGTAPDTRVAHAVGRDTPLRHRPPRSRRCRARCVAGTDLERRMAVKTL